ncbi:FAD-dependent monooxygenase [Streptomyces sp. BI20]|uniref:FAD-dependent monooxygenase n=1 Tax=Streptomyces sp. BI20 TaxID=3403460 RepID=UPI003C7519E0
MRKNGTVPAGRANPEVLVVGAGPTGLTLASALAANGVPVRVLDARSGPHRESRGKGLHEDTLALLDSLGAGERVRAAGRRGITLRKYFDGEFVADTEVPDGLVIGQWRLEEALRGHLAGLGVSVEYGRAVTELWSDVSGGGVRDSSGEVVTFRYLAGCDGGRSAVRRLTGIALDGVTADAAEMSVGDVRAPGLDRDHWHQWFTSAGEGVLMCPIPGTEMFQIQTGVEHDEGGVLRPVSLAFLQKRLDRCAGPTGIRLSDPTWLSSWRPNLRRARSLRRGPVFLAGDAAHVHPIAGGQGMRAGLADAVALADALAEALRAGDRTAAGAAEDRYEAARSPAADELLRDTAARHARVMRAVRRPGRGTEVGLTPA